MAVLLSKINNANNNSPLDQVLNHFKKKGTHEPIVDCKRIALLI